MPTALNTAVSPQPSDRLWSQIKETGKPVSFRSGEYLYPQNESSPGAFFIERGSVKIFRIMDNGIESILRVARERNVLGEVSAINGEESSPAAVALTDVTAYLISTDKMHEMIRSNGDFALYMVNNLAYKLKGQTDQLGNVSGKKVASRLAATLCTLDYYGIPLDDKGWFSISHAELAGIIGATRPHVTAVLGRFKKEKSIEIKKNKVRILSREKLQKTAEEEL